MQPTTARGFLRVASQRLAAAKEINSELHLTLEAQYIGGYAIECSLKALILANTTPGELSEVLSQLTQGAKVHRSEVLLARLKQQGIVLPLGLTRRIRRFDWSTDLRYEIGRKDTGETNGLLKTATEIYRWVEEKIL